HEVDRHGGTLELEPLTQAILDPVAVVARDERRIVDEEAKARRARLRLRPLQEIEPAAGARRRLPLLAQLGEEPGQLTRRAARDVLRELQLDLVEEPLHDAAGCRRDRDERRTLPQARLQARTHVLDPA